MTGHPTHERRLEIIDLCSDARPAPGPGILSLIMLFVPPAIILPRHGSRRTGGGDVHPIDITSTATMLSLPGCLHAGDILGCLGL
jgi:hypothetical protein